MAASSVIFMRSASSSLMANSGAFPACGYCGAGGDGVVVMGANGS